VQSISAGHIAKMTVSQKCTALALLTSESMDVEHEYRSQFRRWQISTVNTIRSR